MKLIVGLGNPGDRYVGTPHNVGFDVVDRLAREGKAAWKRSLRFHALLARVGGDDDLLLVKPQTYMNLSGEAVGALLRFHKLERSDLLVALDDADLPLGRLRIRARGGSAGHRGLASVIQHAGGEDFARVRLGIGRSERRPDLVDQVLSPLAADERRIMEAVVEAAAAAVLCVTRRGVEAAMNRYNAWAARTETTEAERRDGSENV